MSVKFRYQIPLLVLALIASFGLALYLYFEHRDKQAFFVRMARHAGQWHDHAMPPGTLVAGDGKVEVFGSGQSLPQYRSSGYQEPVYRPDGNRAGGLSLAGYRTLGPDDLPAIQNASYSFASSVLPVYWPRHYRGRVMILLHGWGCDPHDWKTRSVATAQAELYGVALVAPDLKKANYLSRWYRETDPRMKNGIPLPGILWTGAVLPAWIRNEFRDPEIRVAGCSTGARGALMAAAFFPSNFSGVGYFSGDWDIVIDKGALYGMAYGRLGDFRKRWVLDNAACLVGSFRDIRVYGAHSARDGTTPVFQTRMMKEAMERAGISCRIDIDDHGGHDWDYWNSKLPQMFSFLYSE